MKTYNGLLFIGDVMLSKTRPGRRLDDNFFELALGKLKYALDFADDHNLKPYIHGSLTKKSFEISVYSHLIQLLMKRDVTIIAGESEYKGASRIINPHSSAKLLSDSGMINLVEESGLIEKVLIDTDKGKETVCVFATPERMLSPSNIGDIEGVLPGEKTVLISRGITNHSQNDELNGLIETGPFDWPGLDLFVTNTLKPKDVEKCGNTTWLSTGPLVRHQIEHAVAPPRFCVWQPGYQPQFELPPHEVHVFDLEGLLSESVQSTYEESEFTQMLKSESLRAKENIENDDFLTTELHNIYSELNVSFPSREIIDNIMRQTSSSANALEGVF